MRHLSNAEIVAMLSKIMPVVKDHSVRHHAASVGETPGYVPMVDKVGGQPISGVRGSTQSPGSHPAR